MADEILQCMTLEQKVGQLLCLGFCGTEPHPDILRVVRDYHVAGFRVTPHARKAMRYLPDGHPGRSRVDRASEPDERRYLLDRDAPRVTARHYAETLNRIREENTNAGNPVPLYFCTDMEGNPSMDYSPFGMVSMPHPMNLAAAGDPDLCRRVARTIGAQIRAAGINWLHSPVLDVNTVPDNPEIGTRSYGNDPDTVACFARESLRGFDEAGVIAAGKHFPGRGESSEDVHFGLATINADRARMDAVHLAPYRALIEAGLPAIMLAHSVFPALDPSGEVATVSRTIIEEVLRGELGFGGVVMTDSFTMGGLIARYPVGEAAVKAVAAGVDLILLKDETALRGEVYHALLDAARNGDLSGGRIDEAVRRMLTAKERAGLLDGSRGEVDPEAAETAVWAPEHRETTAEAAQRSITRLRDRKGILPLGADLRLLVIEHLSPSQERRNDEWEYNGALCHALSEAGFATRFLDFDGTNHAAALEAAKDALGEIDAIIHTGWYNRGGGMRPEMHRDFTALGKPSVFVTNSPYPDMVAPEMDAVLFVGNSNVWTLRQVAEILCGKAEPLDGLHFDPAIPGS